MKLRWTVAAMALAACGIEDEAEYVSSRAEAECERMQECALGFFEAEYSDATACLNELTEDFEELNDLYEDSDCTFVAEEAGPCVSRVRSMSCEEWAEGETGNACDLVWDCREGNQ